jgi:isoamylase
MALWALEEGSPYPLGVSRVAGGDAYNFALCSRYAHDVTLLLFRRASADRPFREIRLDPARNKSHHVWHCAVRKDELADADLYGYRVDGPPAHDRFHWHYFQPDKVLFDPYARGIWFPPTFDRASAMRPGPTMGRAPLGVIDVETDGFDWGSEVRPRHEGDLVIYEVHVRGFTRHASSGVSAGKHGTFAGLIEKIPYLLELGVNAVEVMPIFQFDPQEANYWGYMPISYFVPHAAYSTGRSAREQIDECRSLVKALHAAGIEVILDVVYNHTGEGDLDGPTYNLKGIDNATYYINTGDPQRPYANYSGTGNALSCDRPATRRLVLDSMRWWVDVMHVDGFRFDLASVLSRSADGSVHPDPAIFAEMESDPVLAGVRLIAEPWDAVGLYQAGTAFPGRGWAQWNDKFRDDVRRFVRGDSGFVGAIMTRLYGSTDRFPDDLFHACRPSQSINYVCSHDGFTMYDLVSYSRKHNEANGYENSDGHHENFSQNCGVEGDDELTPTVLERRKRYVKNFAVLLFLSGGTPLLLAGDEFLHTQRGNNNPFNQDNETTWIDWRRLEENRDIFRFFQGIIAFRKSHPSLGRPRHWREDILWYGVGEHVDLSFGSRSLAFALHGESRGDDDIYVLLNMYEGDLDFVVQEGEASDWERVVDTARPSPDDFVERGAPLESLEIEVKAHSIVVLRGRRPR